MKTFLSDFRELDITSLMALNGGYETYSEEPYPNPDADSPNGGSTYEAKYPIEYPTIEDSINNNLNEPYVRGTNDCDAWAWKVIAESGAHVEGFTNPWGTISKTHFNNVARADNDEIYDSSQMATDRYYLGINTSGDTGHTFIVKKDSGGGYWVAEASAPGTNTRLKWYPKSAFDSLYGDSLGALYAPIH